MANLSNLLTRFSVTGDEAEIYVALLKLGTASVSEIAEKMKKNRTATHFHMKKLVEKELVMESNRGRVLLFTATAPAELAERFERMTTDFKSIVPQLEALKTIEGDAPRVQIAESKSGFAKVYDEISSLPLHSTFLAIEGAAALKNELTLLSSEDTKNFYTKIIARDIKAKLVLTEEAERILSTSATPENLNLLHQRTLDIRTYPESTLPFQGLSLMYGTTVAYLFPETNLVITIKHSGIADAYRQTFEALFAGGKGYEFGEKKDSVVYNA